MYERTRSEVDFSGYEVMMFYGMVTLLASDSRQQALLRFLAHQHLGAEAMIHSCKIMALLTTDLPTVSSQSFRSRAEVLMILGH